MKFPLRVLFVLIKKQPEARDKAQIKAKRNTLKVSLSLCVFFTAAALLFDSVPRFNPGQLL